MGKAFNAQLNKGFIIDTLTEMNKDMKPYLDDAGKLRFRKKDASLLLTYRHLLLPLYRLGLIKFKKRKSNSNLVTITFIDDPSIGISILQTPYPITDESICPVEIIRGNSAPKTCVILYSAISIRKVQSSLVTRTLKYVGDLLKEIEDDYVPPTEESEKELVSL